MILIHFVRRPAPVALASLLLTLLPSVGGASTYYVAAIGGADVSNGRSWAEAKQTIQAAVDLTRTGDTVIVSNGVYASGSRSVIQDVSMPNRVVITNAITVKSVNGPAVTMIQGAQNPVTTNGTSTVRGVYLRNNATLIGFTLTNGATRADGVYAFDQSGGGLYCESSAAVVSNCTFSGNSAAEYGGGAFQGTLNNCAFLRNSAGSGGGGAYEGALDDCTFTDNSSGGGGGGSGGGLLNRCVLSGNAAPYGGGASGGTLNDCSLSGNAAGTDGGGAYASGLNRCTLTANSAGSAGGGAYQGALTDCTLAANSAYAGGGSAYSTLTNCTLSGNTVTDNGGGSYQDTLVNCALLGNVANKYGGGSYFGTLNTAHCRPTGLGRKAAALTAAR